MARLLNLIVGTLVNPPRPDERGLSQSTENVLLLTGAVAVAFLVIQAVRTFISGNLVLTLPGR
ncbi:hypothetical protein [Nigerium massiliense]|uniref:hypothetical protein n=1 Tax=Nigerium massiliense TaxID=1522317 RepID=UPI000590F683|nr:hypothetical protein [Nigerium massiliense]